MSVDKMPAGEMRGCQIFGPKVIFFPKLNPKLLYFFGQFFLSHAILTTSLSSSDILPTNQFI